ncbi:hypothetical protein M514_01276 [Trichuris suis]|uniref:Uncharacterized protein n=1 Tax=Trichuris suis TaxID=68888 RepID=A0A085NMS6_9BILA|nr:hypothetical protein M513_01276 [Trichuris suis]KFD70772.1 hypothetical protein M514_01276 [Trichuris suis]
MGTIALGSTGRQTVALDPCRITMATSASVSSKRPIDHEMKGIHGRISALGSPPVSVQPPPDDGGQSAVAAYGGRWGEEV